MSNGTNTPFGFKVYAANTGSSNSLQTFLINPTDTQTYTMGDLVYLNNQGYIDTAPSQTSTNVQPILGVFMGCSYTSGGLPNQNPNGFYPGASAGVDAGTQVVANVLVDYTAVLVAQMSGAGITQAQIGQNFNFTNVANTNSNLLSKFVVTSGTAATAAYLPLKCIGIPTASNNALGNTYNLGLFVINTPQIAPFTVGAPA